MKDKIDELNNKIQELEKQVEELSKKASERDEYHDKYLRTEAEFVNARKRMERDSRDFVKFANENIISELFPILDSFDSAMQQMENKQKESPFLDGLKMLQKKFHKVLEDNGLLVVDSLGEKFDPIKHEAVMKIESDKYKEGCVAEELRKGYMLNGKVLRPAMVKVSSGETKENEDKD
ncbi:MAG: nucleotide exchange factor GrpE [Candidatus Omnitrophica bacterium]|nr:nucleotide exchange factor GrpE [Candidatus Omnitrophota bacterium]